MKTAAKKGLLVLVLAALFTGGALTISLTLASCKLIDFISSNDSDDEKNDKAYDVIFSANGGSGTPPNSKIVYAGYSLTVPDQSGLYKNGFSFGGWNTSSYGSGINYPAGSSLTPTANMTLYAKWENYAGILDDDIDYVTGLANKLEWLQDNARSGGSYTLELRGNETIDLQDLSFGNRTNITITIRGISTNRTISLSTNSSMFYVRRGVTLVLDNRITLRGRNGNTHPLVYVGGGTLVMNNGSAIVNNNHRGVEVDKGGTFTMNGGTISGNGVSNDGGGGVAVWNGFFTMNGGDISGNDAIWGGGLLVYGGTFTMNGGTIYGNTAARSGGGVEVDRGTFIMRGGAISANTANDYGGGVAAFAAVFTKVGGTITGTIPGANAQNYDNKAKIGNAVYAYGNNLGAYNYRDDTAGPRVNLFYYSDGTFTGDWDL